MGKQNKKLAQVLHFDLYGKREEKYDFLTENSLKSIDWNELNPEEPNYFLVNKNFEGKNIYEEGFKIEELFEIQSLGIEFGSKEYFLTESKSRIINFIRDVILNELISDQEIETKYRIKTTSGWLFSKLRKLEISVGFQSKRIKKCINSPFDIKYTYHTEILRRPQREVLENLKEDNIALITLRQSRANNLFCYFLADIIYSKDVISILDRATGFPLYLYPKTTTQQTIDQSHTSTISVQGRTPNLNPEILKEIAKSLGLGFVPEKEPEGNVCYINNPEVRDDYKTTFAPIDLLDYIYAVLHSPTYREKYKEFLKIDFPRVPYPKDSNTFWQLVKLGSEIRQIHLLESPTVENYITQYPIDGDNVISKTKYKDGKVYINENQYFDNVPAIAWEFYIGGYQPAQKWLKDRKNRKLEFEDVQHYQKIIVALSETHRLMQAIDLIEIE